MKFGLSYQILINHPSLHLYTVSIYHRGGQELIGTVSSYHAAVETNNGAEALNRLLKYACTCIPSHEKTYDPVVYNEQHH